MRLKNLILLLLLAVATALPAAAVPTVTLPSNVAGGGPGTTVIVGVQLDNGGASFVSADLSFAFNDALLQYQSSYTTVVTKSMTLTANVVHVGGATGQVNLSLFSPTLVGIAAGSHEVAWVVFKVINATPYPGTPAPLNWVSAFIDDTPATSLVSGFIDAFLTAATLSMPLDAGGTGGGADVWVPVTATPADGEKSFDIYVQFDPTLIQAVDARVTTATAAFSLFSNLSTPGVAKLSLFNSTPVLGTGAQRIAEIKFHVVGPVGVVTPLDLTSGIPPGTSGMIDEQPASLSDGLFTICTDADGDGFASCGGDCNDNDSTIRPGAPEICDGKDNNCDGIIPSNESDVDGDGYKACAGDCNDNNASINPGATETVCDTIDQNCDGVLNGGTTNAYCQATFGNVCAAFTCSTAGACQGASSGNCSLSGSVTYYRDVANEPPIPPKPVANVKLSLTGSMTGTAFTNAAGAYAFSGAYGGVTDTPSRTDTTWDAAVSSLDASKIAQYAVSLTTLTALQKFAGDVSDNGSVTSFDASLVAQYAAHLVKPYAMPGTHFPVADHKQSDWGFSPASLAASLISGSVPGQNFTAVLFGDVTGNGPLTPFAAGTEGATKVIETPVYPESVLRARANAATLHLLEEPTRVRGTLDWKLVLGVRDANGILAMDLGLRFGHAPGLQLKQVRAIGIASSMSALGNVSDGVVKIALFGPQPLSGSGSVLEVIVTGNRGIALVPMALEASANEGLVPVVVDMPTPRAKTTHRK